LFKTKTVQNLKILKIKKNENEAENKKGKRKTQNSWKPTKKRQKKKQNREKTYLRIMFVGRPIWEYLSGREAKGCA
jgi:hypothetical protein